ncbi:MAG: acyl-CoA dehydrogenase, partial [Anaerolineae bacterium]|nr:acyl-CoA dehydrogenase [Anaerolineae bacterium]
GSSCSELVIENLRVPDAARLGDVGDGFKIAMQTLDGGRISIAAQALGIARAAYEAAVSFASTRVAFGQEIWKFQSVGNKIADMATQIDAARLLTYRAAFLKDQKQVHSTESAMCKVFAAETAMRVTTDAIQVHGGYGYTREYPVERHFRDAKITEIYEGTSEIQRMVIAQSIFKGAFHGLF